MVDKPSSVNGAQGTQAQKPTSNFDQLKQLQAQKEKLDTALTKAISGESCNSITDCDEKIGRKTGELKSINAQKEAIEKQLNQEVGESAPKFDVGG